jgi:aminoglycoside phosphotransferase
MTRPAVPDAAQAAVPRFASVLEHPDFRVELDRFCVTEWGWGTPRAVRVHPLKWHRERCTFEVSVETERGWHAAIGKVYETDQPAVFPAMEAIRQAGFGGDTGCSIPRPLAYLPSWRVLLEEKVAGSSTKDILLHGSPEQRIAAAARCGEWLARFHAAAPRRGRATDPRGELSRFRQWADSVGRFGEPFTTKSEQLFRKLERAVPALDDVACCAGHGSYMPEHVLLSGDRTVVIDLDECDVADPGRDLAWFVVSLQRLALVHFGSLQALDPAAERFLAAYGATGRAVSRHTSFYRAVECLHRARRDLVKRAPPVPQWADVMLDAGLGAF